MWIAEEGLDAEGFVKPVMLGELGSVVEADGFAHRLGKLAELASDGPSGEYSLSIDWVLNRVCRSWRTSNPWPYRANSMKSASQWPDTLRPSTSAGRSVIESRCLMKLAGLPPGRRRWPRLSLWRGSRRCQ